MPAVAPAGRERRIIGWGTLRAARTATDELALALCFTLRRVGRRSPCGHVATHRSAPARG
ncbi:hypothetical protein BVI2075_1370014 [Burkholderia vietnamiensis]|nr:hypothetical protein BVI2075_1370014 [Burkholderia vietnamiensis]